MEKGQKILTKKKHVLEYSGVGHLAIAPFVTLINLIKESYKETPEIYHMLLIELSEYKPMLGIEHKEKVSAHIRVLLTRKPHLAESLISMLPDSLSMTVSNTFIFPLQSLPSNMHAIVTSRQSEIYKRVAGKSEDNDVPSEKKSKFDPVTAMMTLVSQSYNYLPSPKPHIRNSSGSPELSYTKPISSSQLSSPKRPDEIHCIKSEDLATASVCQNSLSTISSPKQKNLFVAVKPIFTYPKALKPLNEDSMNEFEICQNTEAYQEEMEMSLKSVDEGIATGNSAMTKSPVLNRRMNRSMENCSPTCSEDSASALDNGTDAYVYEDNFCDAKEYQSLVSLDKDDEKLVRKGENDGSAMGNIVVATLSIADENNNDSTTRSFPYGQSLLMHANIDGDKFTGNANVHSDYRLKLSENNQDKIYTNGSIDSVDSAIHCLEQMVKKSIKRFESDKPGNSCTYSKQPVSIENSASVRSSETCTMPFPRNAYSDGVQLWINCKTSSNKEEFGMNEGNWDRRLTINQLPTDREATYSTDDHKSAKLAQTITKLNNLLTEDCKRIYTCSDQHNMSTKSFDTSDPMITRSYRNGFPSGHHQKYICRPASTFSKNPNNHIFQYQRPTPSDPQPSCVMSHRPKIVYSDHNDQYRPASYPYMTDYRPNVPANCLEMSYPPLPDHTSPILPKLPSEQPFHLRNSQGWSLDALSGKVFSDCRFVRPNLHNQVKQNYGGTDNFWPNFHQLNSSISPIESSLFSKAGSFEVPVSVASSTNPSFHKSSLHIRDYGATLPNVAMNGPIHHSCLQSREPRQHFLNGAIASNIHPSHSAEEVGGHFLSRRSDQQIYFQYPEYGSADFQVDERGTSGSFRSSSETDFRQEREDIDERKHIQNGRIFNHEETSSNEVNFPAVERDKDSIHVAHLLASLAEKRTSGISNVYVD